MHLIAWRYVPNSVGSWQRLQLQTNLQCLWNDCLRIMFPKVLPMYDIVISSPFLIGLIALTVILQLSELIWYLQLAIQLWFNNENEGKIAYPGELHLLDDFSNRCCKSTELVRAIAIILSITSISSCCNWHAFSIGRIIHLTRSHWVRSCFYWNSATWLNVLCF